MDPVSRIVGLLSEEEPRKRIAAAVVLGDLGVKAPPVISALAAMAREELSAIAEPAVEALGKLGARSALPVLLETAVQLASYLGARQPPAVRVEAITALRFALGEKPSARPLRALIKLLEDPDALVARAARDTLTVIPGVSAEELARLAQAKDGELALWAIERLRALGGSRELAQLARLREHSRSEAAVRALAALEGAGPLLVTSLAEAAEEHAAHALAEALERVSLSVKEIARLRAGRAAMLRKSFAV